MAKKIKKKERNTLLTIALAASSAYLIRTFPGGDTVIGAGIGMAFGNPLLGAAVGMLTPSRKSGETIALLPDANPFGGIIPEMRAPSGAETAG